MNTCQNLLLVVIIFPRKLEEFTLGKIQEFTLARIYICPKLCIFAFSRKVIFQNLCLSEFVFGQKCISSIFSRIYAHLSPKFDYKINRLIQFQTSFLTLFLLTGLLSPARKFPPSNLKNVYGYSIWTENSS